MDYFPTPVWVGTMIVNHYLSIVEPLWQGKWLGYDKKKDLIKFTNLRDNWPKFMVLIGQGNNSDKNITMYY